VNDKETQGLLANEDGAEIEEANVDKIVHVTNPKQFKKDVLAWSFLQASFGPYWITGGSMLVLLSTTQAKHMLIARSGFKYTDPHGHKCNKGEHLCSKKPKDPFLFATFNYDDYVNLCTILSILAFIVLSFFFSVVGDYGKGRKIATAVCSVAGAVSLFIPVLFEQSDSSYWLGGLIFIFSQTAFSFAAIFSNAFLAVIVRGHIPDIGDKSRSMANSIAARADIGAQALSCVIQLVFAAVLTVHRHEEAYAARVCLSGLGVLILIQQSVSLYFLDAYPGPPTPNKSYFRLSIEAWKDTWSIRHELPEFFRFLLAMCLLQDAVSTIAIGLSVIAISEVGMGITENTYALCCVTAGSLLADVISFFLIKYKVCSDKSIIFVANLLLTFVPIYSLFLLNSKIEVYVVCFVYGMLQTSVWVYSISINSQLMPVRKEAQLFAVSQITSNGSSWLAPFLIIAIQQAAPSYRVAFCSIIVFFVAGLVFLALTDVKKGLADAKSYKNKIL